MKLQRFMGPSLETPLLNSLVTFWGVFFSPHVSMDTIHERSVRGDPMKKTVSDRYFDSKPVKNTSNCSAPPLYRHRQKPLLLLWFPLIALMCVLDGSDRKALSSCCTAKAYTAQTDASGEHGQAFSSLGTQMFPSGAGWRRPGLTIKAMLSEQRGERLQCFYCC